MRQLAATVVLYFLLTKRNWTIDVASLKRVALPTEQFFMVPIYEDGPIKKKKKKKILGRGIKSVLNGNWKKGQKILGSHQRFSSHAQAREYGVGYPIKTILIKGNCDCVGGGI